MIILLKNVRGKCFLFLLQNSNAKTDTLTKLFWNDQITNQTASFYIYIFNFLLIDKTRSFFFFYNFNSFMNWKDKMRPKNSISSPTTYVNIDFHLSRTNSLIGSNLESKWKRLPFGESTFTIISNRQNVRETLYETNSWRITLGHRYRKQHRTK